VVSSGGIRCRFGDRYARETPSRIRIDGECSDERSRAIVLQVRAIDRENDRFSAEIVDVGGESGWTHPGFAWSFHRCASRATCLDFLPAEQRDSPCPDLTIDVIDLGGRFHLSVRGTRFLARAVPVMATVGGRPVEHVILGSDGSIAGTLTTMPRSGETLVVGYMDGSEQRSCPMP
jgi:hypothetical protein